MAELMGGPAIGGGRGNRRGTKRKGSLNNGPPPKVTNSSTFDWEGQRDRYWRSLDWQAWVLKSQNRDARVHRLRMEGRKEEATALAGEKYKQTPQSRKGQWGGSSQRYDRNEIARLYVDEGKTVVQIAEILDCDPRTAREALRAKGVFEPGRDVGKIANRYDISQHGGGVPRRMICAKGLHSMEKYGKVVKGKKGVNGQPKKNGRYCYACHRIRQGVDPSVFETVDNPPEN